MSWKSKCSVELRNTVQTVDQGVIKQGRGFKLQNWNVCSLLCIRNAEEIFSLDAVSEWEEKCDERWDSHPFSFMQNRNFNQSLSHLDYCSSKEFGLILHFKNIFFFFSFFCKKMLKSGQEEAAERKETDRLTDREEEHEEMRNWEINLFKKQNFFIICGARNISLPVTHWEQL